MRPGAGKSKGASFERLICTRLSEWVSRGKDRDLFWRSAMSGGRSTIALRKGVKLSRQAGDVCAVAPEGHALTHHYYIELKTYRDLDLDSFLFGKGKLAQFWARTSTEADKYQKFPLLIAKQNNYPTLALFDLGDAPGYILLRHIPLKCAVTLFEDIMSMKCPSYLVGTNVSTRRR